MSLVKPSERASHFSNFSTEFSARRNKIKIIGGLILIAIGIKILIEHLVLKKTFNARLGINKKRR
jgi:hypothetical protein